MKKRYVVRSIFVVVCCVVSWSIGFNNVAAEEPEIECNDFFGCTVKNGFNQDFIEQIRQQGKLSENKLTLRDISNKDLKAYIDLLKNDLVALEVRGDKITDITPVGEVTGLTFLSLSGMFNLEDCTPIASLTNLKKLIIEYGKYTSLDFLKSLSELQELTLMLSSVNGSAFSAIFVPPKVTRLYISDASSLNDVAFLSTLPQLYDLGLFGCQVQQWDALKAVNPGKLTLSESNFSDSSLIAHMDKLTWLLLDSTTITHPEVLPKLPNLETLWIANTKGIDDVSSLKDAPKLKSLKMRKEQFPQVQIDALAAAKPDLAIEQW